MMKDRQDIVEKMHNLNMVGSPDSDELSEEERQRVEIAEEFYLDGWEEAGEHLLEQTRDE